MTADRIEIVCHRAANEHAPENTRAAAQLCLDWGVDYVEVDVRTSRDGIMYILHDPTVDRMTNGHGLLSELTSAEIDALDAGSKHGPQFAGERLPRLAPYLRWIKGRAKVYFDVKAVDIDALIDLIHEVGLADECFLWSDDERYMQHLAKAAPHLPLKVNAATPEEVRQAKRDFNARIVEFALEDVTPDLLATCRELDIKSMILEGQKDAERFRRILESGVDMVNLDHADLFIQVHDEWVASTRA